jgi:hypothetical protein
MAHSSHLVDSALAERIAHACAYPFARPACSYLFADGGMHPLATGYQDKRVPVVASGSNAAPERLLAKFGQEGAAIPVTRAVLHEFAVVFAGHFTRYGAIPATLAPHPGAETQVWVTWLSPLQLEMMHESEGVIACREVQQRYDYVELEAIRLHVDGLPLIRAAGAYLSRRMLAHEGPPIRFAEVRAKGCGLHARSQAAGLRLAHQLLDPAASFAAFMTKVLSDADERQVLFDALTPHTILREAHD